METANATAQSAADASPSPAIASQYPPPREGDWEARNFQFGAGEVFDRLRLHYTTIGEASGDPVVLLMGPPALARVSSTPASRANCSVRDNRWTRADIS